MEAGMAIKERLRANMRELRAGLPQAEAAAKSSAICARAARWLKRFVRDQSRGPTTVFTYIPLQTEVDIKPLIETCFRLDCRVAAPRVDMRQCRMHLHYIHNLHELAAGKWGISEPALDKPMVTDEETIDIVFVPGIAFDRLGHRVGFGGGYYDRFFASYSERHGILPMRLSLAYSFQVIGNVPSEAHDVPINVIVTENETILAGKGGSSCSGERRY